MLVSLKWLRDYIKLDLPVDEISEILTAIGLEVEGVEDKELIPGGLKGVVVGEVLTCEQHPNADRLSLTTVNIGQDSPLQIVCGAPNVAAGQKVLVATIGTTLHPTGGDPFKIKKGKIRGEESAGMICAEDELGLGSDHDGIIVLPENVQVGLPAAEHFNIENDTVFEIGLTPNRSDATCHLGVAEDLAAYLKINKDDPFRLTKPSVSGFQVIEHSSDIKVNLENPEAAPRYSGVSIRNIEVKESPDWLKKYLVAIGQRPINNIVDITNFILHELGQPLHAFDLEKISNNEIRVKNLAEGSKFVTLDEVERSLDSHDLMICDGDDNPMCIGGVFGGLNSGVTEKTTSIFLEAAHFEPKSIRRTMTRHGLWTDAARVFEKGSDPNNTVYALKRAALLIKDLAGGIVCSDIVDIYPEEIKPVEIHLRYEKLNDLIGDEIPKSDVHDILSAMNMEINAVDEFGIKVKVPTNKSDVLREVDLIEEVLRIYGFNKVAIPTKISSTIQYSTFPNRHAVVKLVSDFLSSKGWNEMMGLSLIESRKCLEALDVEEKDLVYINNTSNVHLDVMRPDMIFSGLQSVLHNQNHQQTNCRLFEFGKTYKKLEDGFEEVEYLTMFLKGQDQPLSWKNGNGTDAELADMQNISLGLFQRFGLTPNKMEVGSDSRFDLQLNYFFQNQPILVVGIVNEDLLKKIGIKGPVFAVETKLEDLMKAISRTKLTTKPISKFPATSRDLALVLDEQIQFTEIEKLTKKVDKKLIQSVNLFDIYKSTEHLGEGKKSYAVKFVLEDQTKTLTDKEIDKVMAKLVKTFENELGAVVRK